MKLGIFSRKSLLIQPAALLASASPFVLISCASPVQGVVKNGASQDGVMENEVSITAVATMQDDRAIHVMVGLRSETGAIGDALWIYPPDHSAYDDVIAFLGALTPGGTKSVRDWPYELLPNYAGHPEN